jgi:hypothetical protein
MSTSSQTYLGATQNLVSSCSGSVQPLLSSQVALSGATVNYYPIQSGQIISVGSLTAVGAINLPPVSTSAGHTFTIVVSSATLGNSLFIYAGTTCIRGFVLQPAAVGQTVQAMSAYNSGAGAGTAVAQLRINTVSVAGDRVELKSDGTSWFVQGWSGLAAATPSVTFI